MIVVYSSIIVILSQGTGHLLLQHSVGPLCCNPAVCFTQLRSALLLFCVAGMVLWCTLTPMLWTLRVLDSTG
jgi:hypothetical protein